jgi:hypothetical protein
MPHRKITGGFIMACLDAIWGSSDVKNQLGISMHNCHLLNFLRLDFSGLIIGIEPYEISLKFGLSRPMRRDFDNIVVQADKIIQNYIIQLCKFARYQQSDLQPFV